MILATALALAGTVGLYFLWQRALRPWMEQSSPIFVAAVAGTIWVVTGLLVYLWRLMSLRAARLKARTTLATFVDATQAQFDALVSRTVGLAAVTLGWAVRAEMVRDDIQDVQEYMQQLAKRPGIRRALVTKTDGSVMAASEPASVGQRIAHVMDDPPTESREVQMVMRPDGTLRLVIPVMGLEARLGTLLIEYERPVLTSEPVPAP